MIKTETFNGKRFDVATVDLRIAAIRLFWKSATGEPFSSLRNLGDYLKQNRQELLLATNAGIFDKSYAPEGLYIERGQMIIPLNRRDGVGNFYLKPNGVFYVDRNGAGLLSTEDFLRSRVVPIEATQSGPMLVRNREIHPVFDPHSKSQCIRNGVGVISPQKVCIAISQEPVSFYEFATLFRDGLGCSQALYLDGAISKLYCPAFSRTDDGQFVGILGVIKR